MTTAASNSFALLRLARPAVELDPARHRLRARLHRNRKGGETAMSDQIPLNQA